jgi:predicted nucleotidyltransferase
MMRKDAGILQAIPVAGRLAETLVERLNPVAVALGGSAVTGAADAGSDIDLYVYADPIPDIADRTSAARAFGAAPGAEIGNAFFEPGDEWRHDATGTDVDIMYRTPAWIEDRLDAVLIRHEANLGYSTCLWHNVRSARPLADPTGWFAALQERASAEYPEALARAIVRLNWAMTTETKNSWLAQLAAALERGDAVSAGHRTTALLASCFDVLFALNRQPHPGEKRLLSLAARLCPLRPEGLDRDVTALLAAAGRADPAALDHAGRLVDALRPMAAPFLDR